MAAVFGLRVRGQTMAVNSISSFPARKYRDSENIVFSMKLRILPRILF
jgi:hypothetical protein